MSNFSTNSRSSQSIVALVSLLLLVFVESSSNVKQLSINVGPSHFIPDTKPARHAGRLIATNFNTHDISLSNFRTSRQGKEFNISLALSPGSYDLDLGFIETQACKNSTRVFHIFVNGEILHESYDIFSQAGGCHRARVETIPSVSISVLQVQPIELKFVSVSGLAIVSYIRAKPSHNQCVPVTDSATLDEVHLAHSVPGKYKPVIDRDGNGFETIFLDGRESHTHFSYPGGSGKIIAYEWSSVESGEVLSRLPAFNHRFPVGSTRVRLTVTDDACSQHRAETTITVTTTILDGQYCYFYPYNEDSKNLQPQTLWNEPRPDSAGMSRTSRVRFPPFKLMKGQFVTRCILFIDFEGNSDDTTISVNTAGSGAARVFRGGDVVLDSESASPSTPISVTNGMEAFEVIYFRTNTLTLPRLELQVNGRVTKRIFHDQVDIRPIITKIRPTYGAVTGGTTVRLHGFGFHTPMKVWFGDKFVWAYKTKEGTIYQTKVTAPAAREEGPVKVTVQSGNGKKSSGVDYQYGNVCEDVSFETTKLTTAENEDVPLNQPTSVALGNDNRLYLGMRAGNIEVVSYDTTTLKVSDRCSSEIFSDPRYKRKDGSFSPRVILGITFDPRDRIPRPYVSVNTLYWGKRKMIDPDNKQAWSNGAIERFKPATKATRAKNPSQCLQHDRNIVQNLPVSDGDHAVNELLFDQNGDLLITVGGNTNSGLPCHKFGGRWETYFSASVVVARLSRGRKFNGAIPYTNPDSMRTAHPKKGYEDVDLYATGFRNLFSLSMARNGRIYGVDMGPNCGYGNVSTTCSQYDEASASDADDRVPGRFVVDPKEEGECKYGPDRGDKMVELKQGKFYGHANIQRAIMTEKYEECAWIDPKSGRRPGGGVAPSNYEQHLSYIGSAETGIHEYGSTHFCGKLRGDLILSKSSGHGSLRATTKKGGYGILFGRPYKFITESGIRVIENVKGDLLFPQYFEKGVLVKRPKLKTVPGLSITNALPFRHGRNGGTPLTIGGSGFKKGISVIVGNRACPIRKLSPTEIVCTVPKIRSRSLSVSVSVILDGEKRVLEKALLIMNV